MGSIVYCDGILFIVAIAEVQKQPAEEEGMLLESV